VLTHLSEKHFSRKWPSRLLLPVGVLIIIFTHVVEVWVFAFTYLLIFSFNGVGDVIGEFDYTILDYAYFSFVNYTSLGYGDIVPTGHIRFIAGTESLVGLVLIAWSASFTYLEMRRIITDKK
tara:strand:- start:69 stop:434 length:366 start_codon:yes stop_codon:yes gene_type:complete